MTAPTIYQNMMNAILRDDATLAANDVRGTEKLSAAARLRIYSDAYQLRLVGALHTDYPALAFCMGEDAFNQAAAQYVELHPSHSYNLDHYGHDFPDFIRQRDDLFYSDLARLERAIADVFNAPESAPLAPETFAALSPEAFGESLLRPRAASRLLTFNYDVDEYLRAQRGGENPARPAAQNTYLYIHRQDHEVQRTPLTPAGYQLLSALFSGEAVERALNAAAEINADEVAQNLQLWFSSWLQNGFFSA